MIIGLSTQDTLKKELGVRINQVNLLNDSAFVRAEKRLDSLKKISSAQARKMTVKFQPEQITQTLADSVCTRSPIADITFHDPGNPVFRIKEAGNLGFIFNPEDLLAVKPGKQYTEIVHDLRPGEPIPSDPVHKDWVILIMLLIVFLFSFIKDYFRSKMPQMIRVLSLRGINDPAMRNTAEIFQWQSTLLNFITFISLGIFIWYSAVSLNIILPGIKSFSYWLGILGVIIAVVTIRHLVCSLTGIVSERTEVFNEYLTTIYQSMRAGSILVLLVVILQIYSGVISPKTCIIAGIIILASFYLLRISRLLLIFIKRRISLFYLILYLCALEILPVLVTLKYTGLI
ncbi:MAG: DUF4271 domain-containing protein [Bacteroidales bacterium]|nr:DUF4271 domain-containing protein [Bacteroidales bacterium]